MNEISIDLERVKVAAALEAGIEAVIEVQGKQYDARMFTTFLQKLTRQMLTVLPNEVVCITYPMSDKSDFEVFRRQAEIDRIHEDQRVTWDIFAVDGYRMRLKQQLGVQSTPLLRKKE